MCMMCDQESMFLEYLAYLHQVRKEKLAVGEDTSEIDKFLAENGYVNLDSRDSASEQPTGHAQTDAPPTNPAASFSCDPADE